MNKKAVILYSSGLDSTTCLAIAKSEGFDPYAISFSYGQRHSVELELAKKQAPIIGAIDHLIVDFDYSKVGGSALTTDAPVPKDGVKDEIPVTYVPARNTIFLSFALGWAEVLGAFDIFIGVNALDYSGYPDCRPEYIAAFETLANLATKAGVEKTGKFNIRAPLLNMTKAEIIKKGLSLGVDYSLTHSCYDPTPEGIACGKCDSCRLRLKGFAEAGLKDPLQYME
ncbi:MAG: 7-cyano-7-deazaguanine synthase QueC [Desulfuromonadales bacterium]|nr:7-cyano-7-deazaguanine synthase QueC [Desulfuromonadales bacterium]